MMALIAAAARPMRRVEAMPVCRLKCVGSMPTAARPVRMPPLPPLMAAASRSLSQISKRFVAACKGELLTVKTRLRGVLWTRPRPIIKICELVEPQTRSQRNSQLESVLNQAYGKFQQAPDCLRHRSDGCHVDCFAVALAELQQRAPVVWHRAGKRVRIFVCKPGQGAAGARSLVVVGRRLIIPCIYNSILVILRAGWARGVTGSTAPCHGAGAGSIPVGSTRHCLGRGKHRDTLVKYFR